MKLSELLKDAFKEGMTVEEIEKALDPLTPESIAETELAKMKTALDKATKEAGDNKKKLDAKLNEEGDDKKALAAMQEKMDEMVRTGEIAKQKAELLALGYEEKLAGETATAMYDGDRDKVMANQKTFLEKKAKDIEATLLKNTPKPQTKGNPDADGANDDSEKTEAEKIALKFAATATETNKNTTEALKAYLGGN